MSEKPREGTPGGGSPESHSGGAMSSDRAELLARLMAKAGVDMERFPVLPQGRTQREFPLSFAQERLWFLHRLEPTNPSYHIVYAIPMGLPLDERVARKTLQEFVQRHEGFRTSFEERNGQPVQVIHDPPDVPLQITDLRTVSEEEGKRVFSELLHQKATEPFDLAKGLGFRVHFVQDADEGFVLILAMHHILTDGWSAGLTIRDLVLLYNHALHDAPHPLPPLSVQSADFAVWQRDLVEKGALASDLAYWRDTLAGVKPTSLPLDHQVPAISTGKGGAESCAIGPEATKALKELARETGATLFQTVLAAFLVLLSRISGQSDIAVGTPVSNFRERPELANVVGCFLNMLVLRVDCSEAQTFKELLLKVHETAREGFSRQHVPFELLVRELRPDREAAQNPLFNVTFSLDQPHPTSADWLEDKTLSQVIGVDTQTVRFDLEVTVVAADDVLNVGFSYSKELFEAETVARWVEEFRQMVVEMAEDPSIEIGRSSRPSLALLSTPDLLSHLRAMKVKLWLEDEKLRISAPKGAISPSIKKELSDRKEEILEILRTVARSQEGTPIPVVSRDQGIPASFAQQRLWFLDQLAPGSAVYNIPWAIRTARVDHEAFGLAFDALIERHEAMRTSFVAAGDEPILKVHPPSTGNLEVLDLSALPTAERERQAMEAVVERARRSFDLSKAPLIRATVIHLGPNESMLTWCIHHIVADGWSLELIVRDLALLFAGYQGGQQVDLPALPVQFADYSAWQRQRMETETVKEQLSYWTKQLGGRLPVIELPTDRPRPPIQTMSGNRMKMVVKGELCKRLRDLSIQEGVTVFMTLLAAFKVFLFRFTGETDVVVGTPTAGRDKPELEQLVGFFVNNLVLRTDLHGEPRFRELLHRIRRVLLTAHANQEVPFDQLVEVLRPERSMAHPPLFQVMFNSPLAPTQAAGKTGPASELEFQVGTSRFDLTVEVFEEVGGSGGKEKGPTTEDKLTFLFEYNTDLFDEVTIKRFQECYLQILQGVVEEPDQTITLLPVLPERDRESLLVDWNATESEYSRDSCIHDLFEAHARKTPDKRAIQAGETSISYGELDQQSSLLATHLIREGVEPGTLVGLCVDRSIHMPIALLAIFKAGGAYVPLDPTYPPDRLDFMMEDSAAPLLVIQSHLLHLVPDGNARVILLDGDWAEGANPDPTEIRDRANPEDLAYVIYTSGSTGKPKGVQIQHRALTNFLGSMAHEPGFGQDDHLLAVTTLSFDIAGLELFLPLSVGGSLTIASRAEATDALALADLTTSSGATVMQATPATWRLLVKSGWEGSRALKILSGGEAIDRELAEQLRPMGAELWNLYGPTEATIWSSVFRIEEDVEWPVSIGRPIANTQMHILDDHLNPVPIGVAGELYIGGDGLALGYLNRPELTAERFLPYPFRDSEAKRLYRTGDGARYRTDGTIEFLGRLDSQAKIRGFRIELGEIEFNMTQHPSVREAAATVREDVPGDQRLIAYVVQEGEEEVKTEVLQAHLKGALPDYMIPSQFLLLSALPLTPNGKVDRKALPAPEGAGLAGRGAYQAPETEVEQTIAATWQEVLRVERVGLADNFFDLGGHSLLAVRVHSALQERLENPPTLIDLFQYPTVSALAQYLSASGEESTTVEEAPERADRQQENNS